jgi:hypothetical protein
MATDGRTHARVGKASTADVSRFENFTKLGEGVYGDVWRAWDTKLKRTVAVKFVRTSGPADLGSLEHARALARVPHPNIVTVYDVEDVADPVGGGNVQAVVMELVEGPTLTEQLGYVLTREEAQRIGIALVNAIGEYHRRGLAHGDLHDGNVIVGIPYIKVLDPLYFDTSLVGSTASRLGQQARDIRFVRDLLVQLLSAAQVSSGAVAHFACDPERQDLHAMYAAFLEGLAIDSRQMSVKGLTPLVELLATKKKSGGGFKLVNLAAELGWRPSEVKSALEELFQAGVIRIFVLNDSEVVYRFSESANVNEAGGLP